MRAREFALIVVTALLTLGTIGTAQSQTWPQRPVTVVVPFAAGGNTDGIGRSIAQWLSDRLGQQFVVENRGGAGGAIAAEMVAKAPADGYTLFVAALPQIAIIPAISQTRYDPVKDFTPISVVGTNPFVLAVNKDVPVKNVPEFIDYVRKAPQPLSYASAGIGSLNHLSMALFLKLAGIDMIHVPYKGNAPAMSDVVAGHVPAIFTNLSDALPQAAAGTIRLIGVSGETRAPQIPDVPTVAEQGFPTFKTRTWNALMAPAKTDPAIIARVAREVAAAAKDPGFAERLNHLGVDPLGNSPTEFAALIAADIPFWAEAVRIAGVKEQ
ncbi:MAG: tripartite tricarboxylate transporter substrate binding protein [Xanthobacteraceae bacterium]|nr:tripartite tricarboxylate transporter substrate binding protein [Xanthobacteraceae bacterium]MBV9631768.1 tripartite tricarboxylate transporter substrate binding protein [Xanthobacteraceae bacterium]